MRFVWTIGRLTIFDFTLFNISDSSSDDSDVVIVRHHYVEDSEDEQEGPPDLFGGKG